jgi:hypothetical protein
MYVQHWKLHISKGLRRSSHFYEAGRVRRGFQYWNDVRIRHEQVYANVKKGFFEVKTARVQVLTTPAFRDWLRKEARKSGISVGELVRTRCEQRAGEEEAVLAELTARLRKEVAATRTAVRRNLDEAQAILSTLRARRKTGSAEERA